MNSPKFTKEPWRAGKGFNPNHIVSEDGSKLIAQVTNNSNLLPFEESDANRRLIVNAPRMFWKLKEIIDPGNMPAACTLSDAEWVDFWSHVSELINEIVGEDHVDAAL